MAGGGRPTETHAKCHVPSGKAFSFPHPISEILCLPPPLSSFIILPGKKCLPPVSRVFLDGAE